MIDERPEAIILTIGQKLIQTRPGGYAKIVKEWNACNDSSLWYYNLPNAPVHPITTVYIVVMGRIRWKCLLVGIERDKAIQFSNSPEPMYAKAWLMLTDFEAIPRRAQIERKGFQGFRYSQLLY